ncbi:MAG: hypothetical protein KDA80_17125 [Planctomycetaceae bacterium]|nr:hypothetical protein [Planctomycetaceae bacterium]
MLLRVTSVTTQRSLWIVFCLWSAVCLPHQGCINALVMAGKVMLGDPMQTSAFEMATGINLKKDEKTVLVHCTSPSLLTDEFGSLNGDIQVELLRRMKRQGINTLSPDKVSEVLDHYGGTFDPKLLVRELDEPVDYIMHIQLETFSYESPESPDLYHGNASGTVTGYEVRGEGDDKHVVQVFDQSFTVVYPTTHPVPRDRTPEKVFFRRFVDRVTDTLGTSFYDVRTAELFAN